MSDQTALEKQIAEALEGTTEGPWRAEPMWKTTAEPLRVVSEAIGPMKPQHVVVITSEENDARFIAAARSLLPAALSELRSLRERAAQLRRECECGEYVETNDPYMIDAWNEWHEDGAFLAGKYHRPTNSDSLARKTRGGADATHGAASRKPADPSQSAFESAEVVSLRERAEAAERVVAFERQACDVAVLARNNAIFRAERTEARLASYEKVIEAADLTWSRLVIFDTAYSEGGMDEQEWYDDLMEKAQAMFSAIEDTRALAALGDSKEGQT